jgi:hypothetical protein
MSDPTETVPDGPIADSGSREWTQRFLIFGFLSVCAIAQIAWLTMLAWVTLSLTRCFSFNQSNTERDELLSLPHSRS